MHSLRAVLALAVLLLALPSRAQPRLHVSADPQLKCPSAEQLDRALGEGLTTHAPQWVMPADRSLPLLAFRASGPGRMRVELQRSKTEAPLVRTLRAGEHECEALADAAVLLVQSWLQGPERTRPERTQRVVTAPPTRSEPAPELPAVPPLVEAPPSIPVHIEEETAPQPPASETETETDAAPEPPPAPEPEAEAQPEAAIEPEPEAARPPAERRAWRLLALGGGGWLIPSPSLVGTGAVRVERDLTQRFGVGLQLGLESARAAEVEPGLVSATEQSITALARWRLRSPEEMGPELTAGVRLERLSATSRGYTENGSAVLWAPALVAGAAWNQPISRRFFLQGFLSASARARREVFVVANVGEVLVLPPVGLAAGLGIGLNFP